MELYLRAAFQKVLEHNEHHLDDGVSVEMQMSLDRKRKREERREDEQARVQRLHEQTILLEDQAKMLEQERLVMSNNFTVLMFRLISVTYIYHPMLF